MAPIKLSVDCFLGFFWIFWIFKEIFEIPQNHSTISDYNLVVTFNSLKLFETLNHGNLNNRKMQNWTIGDPVKFHTNFNLYRISAKSHEALKHKF